MTMATHLAKSTGDLAVLKAEPEDSKENFEDLIVAYKLLNKRKTL